MSTLDQSLRGTELPEAAPPTTRWDRFETVLTRFSEHLNPILVKEARQALRSRQFTVTFFLMLAAGWGWSILGLAILGPGVYYSSDGPTMFYGYHVVLAFPLLVIVPYAAFHSLSAERQDRTYELVSITSLDARQILSGKLCGIMLQMMIYLSAVFPCLAFTYLLRGLDIFTIILAVVYTCFMSLGLSVLGLLFATVSPPRQRQISQAVIFAVALFGGFWINMSMVFGMLMDSRGIMVESPEFWQANLAALTFYISGFSLAFLTARSQLTPVSQNRSTALRVALVGAQLVAVYWAAWAQLRWGGNVIFGLVFASTVLWYYAGIFLTGESGTLSPRVKRDLPQTSLGRVFLAWFTPGPGTGYLLAVCGMIAMTLVAALPFNEIATQLRVVAPLAVPGPAPAGGFRLLRADVLQAAIIATCYVIIYLGIGKLIMAAIGRFTELRPTARVLVHFVLLLLGGGIPWTFQMSQPVLRSYGYTLWQITNPVWTIWECCYKGVPVGAGGVLGAVLPLAALVVLGLNMPSLTDELTQVRVPKPPRVAEEDAALAALKNPAPARSSPWD
jgi:hypothetical protein